MTRTQPERIRVLHLSPMLDQGGLERLQIEFARFADKDRYDLRFLAIGRGGRTVEDLREFGCQVEAFDRPDGLNPSKITQLAAYFRKHRPEVVHTHNNGPLIYGAPAAKLAGVPAVVHTRHHGRAESITKGEVALATAASKLVDRVVCVSEDSLREGKIEGISPRSLLTIWNGINLSRFDYRGPDPTGPAVTVARLQSEKSIDTLIRAAALVVKEAPEFRVEIAGEGVDAEKLKALAVELNVKDIVKFHGNVKDVPALLARCSVMVLPSLTEGISLTLLEASARGLPIVTTRVGGNPEVVIDGLTGLLVMPKSEEELAGALLKIHRDPDAARRMGVAGRERVERHFDAERMVADYEALYLEVLRKKRGRGLDQRLEALADGARRKESIGRLERAVPTCV